MSIFEYFRELWVYSHIRNTRWICLGQSQSIRPEAGTGVDQRTVLLQSLTDRFVPLQSIEIFSIRKRISNVLLFKKLE